MSCAQIFLSLNSPSTFKLIHICHLVSRPLTIKIKDILNFYALPIPSNPHKIRKAIQKLIFKQLLSSLYFMGEKPLLPTACNCCRGWKSGTHFHHICNLQDSNTAISQTNCHHGRDSGVPLHISHHPVCILGKLVIGKWTFQWLCLKIRVQMQNKLIITKALRILGLNMHPFLNQILQFFITKGKKKGLHSNLLVTDNSVELRKAVSYFTTLKGLLIGIRKAGVLDLLNDPGQAFRFLSLASGGGELYLFCFLRQVLQPVLVSNSLSAFCSLGTTGVCQHAWPVSVFPSVK